MKHTINGLGVRMPGRVQTEERHRKLAALALDQELARIQALTNTDQAGLLGDLAHDPNPTIETVLSGLGLTRDEEDHWLAQIPKLMARYPTAAGFATALQADMRESGMHPTARRFLAARALVLYRAQPRRATPLESATERLNRRSRRARQTRDALRKALA